MMERKIKCSIKSQDAQQNDESTRPIVQNIIVNIYYVQSVDTPISTSENQERQTGLRQEKKITISEWIVRIWKCIERINLTVDFFNYVKEAWCFLHKHWPVLLDFVKHFFYK